MKKSTRIRFTTMILIVILVVITVLSSCSADNSTLTLCNINLDIEELSRNFNAITYINNISEATHFWYSAKYKGSGSSYGETDNGFVEYEKSKGIILSQGLWSIECKWTKRVTKEDNTIEDVIIAQGNTGDIWVNLNTSTFVVYLEGKGAASLLYNAKCNDNSVNNISFDYALSKCNTSTSFESIIIESTPTYFVGSEQYSLRVLSLPIKQLDSGKYLLTINVYDEESQPHSLLFTDVLGFVVYKGVTTEIKGECYLKKYVSQKNEYIYWEQEPQNPQNTTNVGGNNTNKLNEIEEISSNCIYVVNSDGKNGMELGHSTNSTNSSRIVKPNSDNNNPINFGINLNGTDVTLTTANGTNEKYVIIDLPKYSEMTLYNYSESATDATWAKINQTPLGLYRRFESNVIMDGGVLNIVGPNSPSKLSNGSVIFRGPVATDSDERLTLLINSTRKQGAINFNKDGGTVVVDGNVSFEASVGFSSWSTSKPGPGQYETTISSKTNINITVKNNADISVEGDTKNEDKFIDTAYGVYLIGSQLTENDNGGTINILLDNGMIHTSGSGIDDESGIRIDNYYNGNINITLKNGAYINSDKGSGLYFNNCSGSVINLMIASDNPNDTVIGLKNKIRIGDNTSVNIYITDSSGNTRKAIATQNTNITDFDTLVFTSI